MKMQKFTFYVEGCGIEVSVLAETQKQAHAAAWQSLTDTQKDRTACLDLIDVEPA